MDRAEPQGKWPPKMFLLLAMGALPCAPVQAQDLSQLPDYKPSTQVTGTLRIGGNHHQDVLLKYWEEGFRKYQPGVKFDVQLKSTANAIPALSFGLIDIGVLGRGILPLEALEFRREFRYPPTEIAIATGSYDVTLETAAFAIFVRKDNPLTHLSLKQLDAIFGYEHRRGAAANIRTWGQLGLTGEWADKPIHTYGFAIARFDRFWEDEVFGGSTKWNPDMREYSDIYPPDGNPPPAIYSGQLMMRDLAKDPYGIAYATMGTATPDVKTIALSVADDGPFVALTRKTVADRSYPLARSIYMYINRAPGKPVDPVVSEFLHYLLSRQGQREVERQTVYFPLTPALVQEDLKRLQ